MGDTSADRLRAELALLAASFVLSGSGPDVNRAIEVACGLLVCDLDTPGTVAVAALPYGTLQRDAESAIRDMLHEQGFPAPEPDASEAEDFATVLRAVGAGGVQVGHFFSFFLHVLPAWEQQDELQRRLVLLFQDWVEETTPEHKSAVAAAVRMVAREAMAGTT